MRAVERVLRWAAGGLAAAFVLAYFGVAGLRLSYPFELEWMEGGSLQHVARILEGEAIYVAPTIDFVPFIYTPLYFYVSALWASLFGPGFLPLRLVSLLASLGCLLLIATIVRRHAGDRLAPLLAAGLYASFFAASGAWFDIARADSLFLCLFLAGVDRVDRGVTTWGAIAAAILFALSFFAKQSALFMAIPIAAAIAIRDRRRGILLALIGAALIGGGTILLDAIHNGWFRFYVFELPRLHGIVPGAAVSFLTRDLLRTAAVALAASIAFFALLGGRSGGDRVVWAGIALGMLGGTFAVRIREGSFENVLMPAYALLAILFGIGLDAGLHRCRRPAAASALLLTATAQFAILIYNPSPFVPTKADRDAGRSVVELIRRIDGDVLVPAHGYLAVMAGKPGCAHMMALGDILRCDRQELRNRLIGELESAVASHRFGAIIDDGPWLPAVERSYILARRLFEDSDRFRPVTGLPARPERLLLPRN